MPSIATGAYTAPAGARLCLVSAGLPSSMAQLGPYPACNESRQMLEIKGARDMQARRDWDWRG